MRPTVWKVRLTEGEADCKEDEAAVKDGEADCMEGEADCIDGEGALIGEAVRLGVGSSVGMLCAHVGP